VYHDFVEAVSKAIEVMAKQFEIQDKINDNLDQRLSSLCRLVEVNQRSYILRIKELEREIEHLREQLSEHTKAS